MPVFASYSLHIKFAILDFPLPVLPKIPNTEPSFIVKFKFSKAVILVSLYVRLTFLNLIFPLILVGLFLVFIISGLSLGIHLFFAVMQQLFVILM